jgi:hypothetical protein
MGTVEANQPAPGADPKKAIRGWQYGMHVIVRQAILDLPNLMVKPTAGGNFMRGSLGKNTPSPPQKQSCKQDAPNEN